MIAVGMFFFGLIVMIVVLGVLSLIPRTSQALARHKVFTVAVILVYLSVLALHPYVFGLPGRIAEIKFQRQIHPGVTRSEVVRLAQRYGGTTPFFGDFQPGVRGPEGGVNVWFVDWETFCIVDGNDYSFYFAPDSTLRSWKVQRLSNAC